VLTISEVEQVLRQPDLSEPIGLRDRAILETLYSTGMRRRELMGLSLFDLDRERGTVMIRQGKDKKDRMIPIGERAVKWIDRYQYDVRPALIVGRMNSTLFLTHTGEPFTPNRLTQLVRGRESRESRQERLLSPVPPHDGDADARVRPTSAI
jgi:integrase/recombinase XerD